MKIKVWQYFTKYPQRWIRGEFHKLGGKCCLVGAVENQYMKRPAIDKALDRIRAVLNKRPLAGPFSFKPTLTEWNDNPYRTVEEVIALCKAAKV